MAWNSNWPQKNKWPLFSVALWRHFTISGRSWTSLSWWMMNNTLHLLWKACGQRSCCWPSGWRTQEGHVVWVSGGDDKRGFWACLALSEGRSCPSLYHSGCQPECSQFGHCLKKGGVEKYSWTPWHYCTSLPGAPKAAQSTDFSISK